MKIAQKNTMLSVAKHQKHQNHFERIKHELNVDILLCIIRDTTFGIVCM